MALFMEDERDRLRCSKCVNITFYEREIYGYIKKGNNLESTLDKVQIICSKCESVAHEIKSNKGTIKR